MSVLRSDVIKQHRDQGSLNNTNQTKPNQLVYLTNSFTHRIAIVITLFFPGNDPATDLRGCGMLGLVQLVYLVSSPAMSRLAADIYKLSLHHLQVGIGYADQVAGRRIENSKNPETTFSRPCH